MKIICIANNYKAQNIFKQIQDEKLLFYAKPDTSPLTHNRPFFFPDFCNNITGSIEWVIRIDKLGKYIEEKFATTYYHQAAIGINLLDSKGILNAIKNGQPWEEFTSFENSLAIGDFFELSDLNCKKLEEIEVHWKKNEINLEIPNFRSQIFGIDKAISHISKYFTLKTGDLVCSGSPIEPIELQIGDCLDIYISNAKYLRLRIK